MSFYTTNSFCSFILLGTKLSWVSLCEKQLSNKNANKIKYERMIIYQIDGFDFIFPIVNLDDIDDVYNIQRFLKEFINIQHYLESHIIFFMTYMSPKIRQILNYIRIDKTIMNIVSFIPGKSTSDMYFNVCINLNINSEFITCNFQLIELIKKIINNTFLCDLFVNIFIS